MVMGLNGLPVPVAAHNLFSNLERRARKEGLKPVRGITMLGRCPGVWGDFVTAAAHSWRGTGRPYTKLPADSLYLTPFAFEPAH